MNINPNFDWDDAACAKLRRLWVPDGPSARAIGAELGCSRNAVIGKAGRLELEPRSQGRPPTSLKPRPKRTTKFQHKTTPVRPPAGAPLVIEPPTGPQITFMQIEPHHCRYPSGEGSSILFCGATAIEDMPYCPFHSRVCYQPAKGARG